MTLSYTALSVLCLVSLGLAAIALVVAFARGRHPRASSPDALPPQERVEALLASHAKALQRLEGAVRFVASEQKRLDEQLRTTVQHVGIVRFDAFEEMGGRLSFSAALLDGRGDGIVITSINGRQDTRCYAKRVEGGTSIHNLTDEEEEAIREAVGAARQTVEAG